MPVLLRDYQEEMISGARRALKVHRRVLLQAPTGAGKTVLAAFMISESVARGRSAWFICHRAELVEGTSKTLAKFGIPHGFIAAGVPRAPGLLTQVCSIDTLKARLSSLEAPRLAVIDEAHHAGAEGWAAVIAWLHANGTIIVGLSATPKRPDGRGLDGQFDDMVMGPSVAWLMERGHLARYAAYIPGGGMDMGGVRKHAGDFSGADIDRKTDKGKLVGDCITHWRKLAGGLRSVGFGYSLPFSRWMAEQFTAAGIPAAHLDGETPGDERRRIIQGYASGEILVLWNRFLFGEGFDLAAIAQRDVTIDCVIDNAPTVSLPLAMQRWGRCLRPSDQVVEKVILDHAGNTRRHGFPEDEREWSLEGEAKGASKRDGPPPPVDCPGCFRQLRRPLPDRCPTCGHQLDLAREWRPKDVIDAELKKATEAEKRAVRYNLLREQSDAKSLAELVNLGRKRGHRDPITWAGQIWRARKRKHEPA